MEGQGLNANNIIDILACTTYSVIYWIRFLSKGLWAQCHSTDPSSSHEKVLHNSYVPQDLQHLQGVCSDPEGATPCPGPPWAWSKEPFNLTCEAVVEMYLKELSGHFPSTYWSRPGPGRLTRQDPHLYTVPIDTSHHLRPCGEARTVHVFCTLSVVPTCT